MAKLPFLFPVVFINVDGKSRESQMLKEFWMGSLRNSLKEFKVYEFFFES